MNSGLKATYSTSIVDVEMITCLALFYENAPPEKGEWPNVDFLLSDIRLSLNMNIQSLQRN